ncbi:ABC transporter ATP-binding protein [Wolbachia endosymbiont (group B) of Melanostoma mellinum]|uniref:ABC transporter ATP-binding protein n=1 Tax=Wolbachia endosymbiont (group B) of Melanostoma mellinum TaxID=2954030 RepID=UPI002230136E|nr:ABC transporter ATP-binding protein [Wolbachia endosymbiont (group B) of Melanostoma mellinum]
MGNITKKQVLGFIIRMLYPFKWEIILMCVIALVWAIDVSLSPYLVKMIIDRVSTPDTKELFHSVTATAIFYMLILFLIACIHRVYDYLVNIRLIPNLHKKVNDFIFKMLLSKSHSYYQNEFPGSLACKVNQIVDSIPHIIQIVVGVFLYQILALSIAVYALWMLNANFAITMLTWALTFIILSAILLKRLVHLSTKCSEYESIITGKMVEVFFNILSVRLFSRNNTERLYLKTTREEASLVEQKTGWIYFLIFCVYGFSYVIVQGFNFYFLIRGRQEGVMTVGDFILVMAINSTIVSFLWVLTRHFSQFIILWGKVTNGLQTILLISEIQDQPNAPNLVVIKGEISFDKVYFNYKATESIFQNKSVTISAGQKVGLVGYSGSGKSTFVNLILRLYDVTSGRILIDNQDIRNVTQNSLHENIAMIPQDPCLFHRTIMENIRYGKMNANDEEVIEAAKKACCHEFISKLPQGYDSLVGNRGIKLSGGERQRIIIARAILKNAPILILDEATSQLDSITENYIQGSLCELMQGKTTIVIAHRLSTILNMDRILVFDRGKIVEDGNHKELLDKDGLYQILWNTQVSEF